MLVKALTSFRPIHYPHVVMTPETPTAVVGHSAAGLAIGSAVIPRGFRACVRRARPPRAVVTVVDNSPYHWLPPDAVKACAAWTTVSQPPDGKATSATELKPTLAGGDRVILGRRALCLGRTSARLMPVFREIAWSTAFGGRTAMRTAAPE